MAISSFDAIVSYHHNIHTCGVARFNRHFADHLAVPMVRIDELVARNISNPIVSVKQSEMRHEDLGSFLEALSKVDGYTLVLHDYNGQEFELELLKNADRVMALSAQLAESVRKIRRDVLVGFAVASYMEEQQIRTPELRLITFGMAHKIQSRGYQRVGQLLASDDRDYVLEISSALHEGTEFDDSFFTVGDEISECFKGNVEFLGFLADNEVARRLTSADAMLAFFPSGVRENNTSVIGAMNTGLPVITNVDEWSPSWARHDETIFDVGRLERFPSHDDLKRVGEAGRGAVVSLTFAGLTKILTS
ncbi:MAG: hypothetical protein EBX92_06880 [Actinobacteria bacterium]|nr:hypothetical protein [Actinomycetota bacterium]